MATDICMSNSVEPININKIVDISESHIPIKK